MPRPARDWWPVRHDDDPAGASGLRHRTGAFVATFLSAAFGAAILMTFASLLDTAGAAGVDDRSVEGLVTTASVAGGWCLLIVVFAVGSTMTLSVRQRDLRSACYAGPEPPVHRSAG